MKKIKVGGLKTIKLIICMECQAGLPLIPENLAPMSEEISTDNYTDFITEHAGHTLMLKCFSIISGPWRIKKVPWSEPVKTVLFLAKRETNFCLFLMKRGRADVYQPHQYQLFPFWRWKTPVLFSKMACNWIFG
jgi:hypothetical protein